MNIYVKSQCTYRCVVLPDGATIFVPPFNPMSQCTYQVRGAP